MGTISSSATLGSTIDLNVIDHQVLKVLGVGVGLEVVHQSQHGSDRFLGPPTEGLAELSSLTGPADAAEVFGVGNAASMGENILEVLFGLSESQTLDCLGGLVGILIMDAEVSARGLDS